MKGALRAAAGPQPLDSVRYLDTLSDTDRAERMRWNGSIQPNEFDGENFPDGVPVPEALGFPIVPPPHPARPRAPRTRQREHDEGGRASEPFVEGWRLTHLVSPRRGTHATTRAGLPEAASTFGAPTKRRASRAGRRPGWRGTRAPISKGVERTEGPPSALAAFGEPVRAGSARQEATFDELAQPLSQHLLTHARDATAQVGVSQRAFLESNGCRKTCSRPVDGHMRSNLCVLGSLGLRSVESGRVP
jgi:hypothetical protein